MRIVWVNERADFVGGAERYLADAARLCRDRGHESMLLYGVSGWMEPTFTSVFDAAFPMVDVARQLKELAPDIVFVHQLREVEVTRAIAACGVPTLRYFHDHRLFCLREHKYTTLGHETCTRTVGIGCYPCLGFIQRGDGPRRVRLRTLGEVRNEQAVNQGFSAWMVGSEYMKAHVAAHGFDADRILVNPPFVLEPPPPEGTVRRDPNLLLFVGALLRGKGLDLLLEALTQLRAEVRLRVVGTGAQEALHRELAAKLGVAARVEFVGRRDRAGIDRDYREAACVVVPSRTPETFGLIGPEALLRETPVVASAVGGTGEWLLDGKTGRSFPSGDVGALVAAIERMLADADTAHRLATEGRDHVRTHFGAEAHATRLLGALEKVRSGGRT
ncbi:MAG: glycosyltransferase family 4 protein [Myxococcales bacterium]|nr:glycosyltransferase family 4 protein [Myxococcales bacterium]